MIWESPTQAPHKRFSMGKTKMYVADPPPTPQSVSEPRPRRLGRPFSNGLSWTGPSESQGQTRAHLVGQFVPLGAKRSHSPPSPWLSVGTRGDAPLIELIWVAKGGHHGPPPPSHSGYRCLRSNARNNAAGHSPATPQNVNFLVLRLTCASARRTGSVWQVKYNIYSPVWRGIPPCGGPTCRQGRWDVYLRLFHCHQRMQRDATGTLQRLKNETFTGRQRGPAVGGRGP